ncbi:hypothetical protein AYX14_05784 [Cryptococcus neoformans]|nr:hypothetical protein AYX14_05784 [Cryptococcus neoformans var. grubii]OXC64554.1 hypothetical protein AYX13_06082 [Cryptococcus neoformans var. grubii]
MSLSAPTRILRKPAVSRQFSTSRPVLASRGPSKPEGLGARSRPWSVQNVPKFAFDDATSLGWMRMFRIQEGEGLVRKIEEDREALRTANQTKFTPPTAPIRLTSTIDLARPDSRYHTKCVLLVPITALPLSTSEAVHRFKLLAGPRWTPGKPGRNEFIKDESNDGENGWIKISEERFESARQNRRSASDILERLVNAANDRESPLPADLPIDTRHLLARHRKKRSRQNTFKWAPGQEFLSRHQEVGGVRGFPVNWLPEELRERVSKK